MRARWIFWLKHTARSRRAGVAPFLPAPAGARYHLRCRLVVEPGCDSEIDSDLDRRFRLRLWIDRPWGGLALTRVGNPTRLIPATGSMARVDLQVQLENGNGSLFADQHPV